MRNLITNRTIKFMMFLFIAISFRNIVCYGNETIEEVYFKKDWIVKFNKPINPITINGENIVIKDNNNNTINGVRLSIQSNGQVVEIKAPEEGYNSKYTYTLLIKDSILSKDGKKLKEAEEKKFKIKYIEANNLIMGKSILTKNQMAKYVLKHNPNPKIAVNIEELAEIFLEEGEIEGVRGDVAFCQSIKETGYFKYGGQVLPEQNNYSGIGALNNSPIGAGAWFKDSREGVRAQIQHIKAYACKEPLINECVDPRFNLVSRGSAVNWEDLNGKWALPGIGYGQDIIKIYDKIRFM